MANVSTNHQLNKAHADLNTHRLANKHGVRLNAAGEYIAEMSSKHDVLTLVVTAYRRTQAEGRCMAMAGDTRAGGMQSS